MLGNIIAIFAGIFSNVFNFIQLKRKKVIKGENFHLKGFLQLYGQGKIVIGNNVKINSCENSNPIGGMTHSVISVAKDACLTIGNNVGISNCAIVSHNSIAIEDNVLIGGSVKIYDTDFHSLDYSVRGKGSKDKGENKPVRIKRDAFVGAHSVILKGVTIGEKAIIGAGSVVTKSVPDGEIWAGNPAKFIRKL